MRLCQNSKGQGNDYYIIIFKGSEIKKTTKVKSTQDLLQLVNSAQIRSDISDEFKLNGIYQNTSWEKSCFICGIIIDCCMM